MSANDTRAYGRGSGVPHPVDVHVGKRVRMRRLLVGMNQETLARALGLTFQQVQKYENGSNRISASCLSLIANILGVPVAFFFADTSPDVEDEALRLRLEQTETLELIRFYYEIHDARVQKQFLEMVKAVADMSRARAQSAAPPVAAAERPPA